MASSGSKRARDSPVNSVSTFAPAPATAALQDELSRHVSTLGTHTAAASPVARLDAGAAAGPSPSGAPRGDSDASLASVAASASSALAALPDAEKKTKRTDYISWDDFFLSLAFLSAQRSKGAGVATVANVLPQVVLLGYDYWVHPPSYFALQTPTLKWALASWTAKIG